MKFLRVGLFLSGFVFLTACASQPHTASGRKMKLEKLRHDWQTTYVYRAVDE